MDDDEDAHENSTECRFEKTSTSWDTTLILRVEHKKALKNGCIQLTTCDGETQTSTEIQTCRGEANMRTDGGDVFSKSESKSWSCVSAVLCKN